jgi:hypothetical protein
MCHVTCGVSQWRATALGLRLVSLHTFACFYRKYSSSCSSSSTTTLSRLIIDRLADPASERNMPFRRRHRHNSPRGRSWNDSHLLLLLLHHLLLLLLLLPPPDVAQPFERNSADRSFVVDHIYGCRAEASRLAS